MVVPAYNEETQIAEVINTMPDFVDRIVVVNDKSKDKTADIVAQLIQTQPRIVLPEKIERKATRYNRAEQVVDEMNKKELEYFLPSETVNQHPCEERLILINQVQNGGVGAAWNNLSIPVK